MAVTKIHPIKTTLNKAIDYICNPDKTDDKVLISSYGCSYETADIEFGFTLSKARDKGDNLGHHLIQSFGPGEVSYFFPLFCPGVTTDNPCSLHSLSLSFLIW